MEEYKIKLLKLAAQHDAQYSILWDEELNFCVLCNDLFSCAFSEIEEIKNEQDVELFEQCLKDCGYTKTSYADQLYACRKRRMRPQREMYKHIPTQLHPLFDACGPEREVSAGNPVKR